MPGARPANGTAKALKTGHDETHEPSREAVELRNRRQPLFREKDRDAIRGVFDLWDYDDVRDNSDAILTRRGKRQHALRWRVASDRVALFQAWINEGSPE